MASTVASVSVPTAVDGCARSFLSLARSLRGSARFAEQVASESVLDEFDRFKLWAGNIAAHRKGRRSLEYRLRDAPQLKVKTNELLASLSKALHNATDIVEGRTMPWDEETYSDSNSDSDRPEDDNFDNLQGDTELKQLHARIKSAITSLMRLSMAMREPAPDAQARIIDKSHFEQHDMLHVQAKFPTAPSYLVERLGRAISSRRQYLTYRETHHNKLTKDIEKLGFETARTEFTTNSTEATMPQHTEDINPMSDRDDRDDKDDNVSMTSYATSVNATLRAPKLPKEASEKGYYNCPLCFGLVSIHTAEAWKRHVFQDLHPYCCTFEDCTTADRLFDSRHTWFSHELQAHHTSFVCVEGCSKTFPAESDFERHIKSKHAELAAPRIFPALLRASIKCSELTELRACGLCDKRMTLRMMPKHLGHHQEELALFALPINHEDVESDRGDDIENTNIAQRSAREEEDDEASTDKTDGSSSELISDAVDRQNDRIYELLQVSPEGPAGVEGGLERQAAFQNRVNIDSDSDRSVSSKPQQSYPFTVDSDAGNSGSKVLPPWKIPPTMPFEHDPTDSRRGYSEECPPPHLMAHPVDSHALHRPNRPERGSSRLVPRHEYPDDDHSPEDAMLKRMNDLLLEKAVEEAKKENEEIQAAALAKYDRLEALLVAQQEAQTAKHKAVANAARAAADTERAGDEDKLARLEKLILAQNEDQLSREAAGNAARNPAAGKALSSAESRGKLYEARKEIKERITAHIKALTEARAAAEKLDEARQAAQEEASNFNPSDVPRDPLKFIDAVGRKFTFPWRLCSTWKGMEELIKQAFLHVDVVGPQVHRGHYDLTGPDGEIVLPQVWETMVEPGWIITMHMWPMPEPRDSASQTPTPPVAVPSDHTYFMANPKRPRKVARPGSKKVVMPDAGKVQYAPPSPPSPPQQDDDGEQVPRKPLNTLPPWMLKSKTGSSSSPFPPKRSVVTVMPPPASSEGPHKPKKKPAPGGFFAWAAGGDGRSKSSKKRDKGLPSDFVEISEARDMNLQQRAGPTEGSGEDVASGVEVTNRQSELQARTTAAPNEPRDSTIGDA